ncbi:MAG: peptide chain release factor N(5)-glutamine methyltransferase [Pseudomonadota bacterium]
MELLGAVLLKSAAWLRERGVPSPRLDAELLLAHALGVERLQLYLQHDRPLDDAELTALRELVRRRGQREPVAYLTGHRAFWERDFRVAPGLLVPRPDSEVLVEALLARIPEEREEPLYVADVGCGTGCLGLSVAAARPCVRLYAVDVNRAALACTKENAEGLDIKARVALLEGDLLAPIPPERPVDWVISNPPYIPRRELAGLQPEVGRWEDRRALDGGEDGLAVIRRLLPAAFARARTGLIMEHAFDQGEAVGELARVAGFVGVETLKDLGGNERCVVAMKDGGAG